MSNQVTVRLSKLVNVKSAAQLTELLGSLSRFYLINAQLLDALVENWKRVQKNVEDDVSLFMFCHTLGMKEMVIGLPDGDALVIPCRSPVWDKTHLQHLAIHFYGSTGLDTIEKEFSRFPTLTSDLIEKLDGDLVANGVSTDAMKALRDFVRLYEMQQGEFKANSFVSDVRIFRAMSGLRSIGLRSTVTLAVVSGTNNYHVARLFAFDPAGIIPSSPPILASPVSPDMCAQLNSYASDSHGVEHIAARGGIENLPGIPVEQLGHVNTQVPAHTVDLSHDFKSAINRAGVFSAVADVRSKSRSSLRLDVDRAQAVIASAIDPTHKTAVSVLKNTLNGKSTLDAEELSLLSSLFSGYLDDIGNDIDETIFKRAVTLINAVTEPLDSFNETSVGRRISNLLDWLSEQDDLRGAVQDHPTASAHLEPLETLARNGHRLI